MPGTVPDGPTAVADAGILVGANPGGARAQADGSDRLLVSQEQTGAIPRLDTYDAGDVLALGPGGDATAVGPVVSREGILVAFVELAEPALGLVILTVSATFDAIDLLLVDVAGPGEEIRLTTAPHLRGTVLTGPNPVEVLVGSEGIFVRLEQSGRGGSAGYLWSLDDPCTPRALVDIVDATTSTVPAGSAPAATPVDAAARFTG